MVEVPVPFLVVNPKSYLNGEKSLELAKAADKVAEETGIAIFFTCPIVDIRLIAENTEHLIVTSQTVESLVPGRGMGHIVPEHLYDAGCRATFINHAENVKTLAEYRKCIERCHELGMITLACADSTSEAQAVTMLGGDIILAEPTDLIGTGQIPDDEYIEKTIQMILECNPDTHPMIASGVSTADDCYKMVVLGSDGTGGTSGILNAPSPADEIRYWADAIIKAYKERTEK